MNYLKKFNKSNITEKLFLISIIFLPISLIVGSAVINSNIIITNLIFLFIIFFKQQKIFEEKTLLTILSSFFLLLVFLVLFSLNFENSLYRTLGFLRHVILVLSLVYVFKYFKKTYLDLILKFWLFIFLIISLDLLYEFIFGYNSLGYESYMPGRLVGFMEDELKIGNLYMGLAGFVLGYLMKFYSKKSTLLITSVIFIIFISFIIGERANFLRLFLISYFLINFHFYLTQKKKIVYFNLILIFLLSLFVTLITLSSGGSSNATNFKARYYYQLILPIKKNGIRNYIENSTYGKHYNAAFRIFNENSITGAGLKNFRVESFKLDINQDQSNKKYLGSTHPHQIHLEFLAETGLIGYFGWIIFIITSIIYSIKRLVNNFNYLSFCGLLYIIIYIFVPLPTGSFFSSYPATIFWLNYSLMMSSSFRKS